MSATHFVNFQQWVLGNPEAQLRLCEIEDLDAFMTVLMQIAAEQGYPFTRQDAEAAMQAGRVAWLERWLSW